MMLSCAGSSPTPETERTDLQWVARAFIAELWNRSHPKTKCAPADVTLHKPPRKQLANTDVFFSVLIRGAIVLFLIEDKVRTSDHRNQLPRYAKWLKNQMLSYGATDDVKVY